MIQISILTLIAFAFLLFLLQQVRGRYTPPTDPGPVPALPLVDLEAFRNLTDPNEEAFLRHRLSAPEFRKIQRLRLRAADLYVSALSHNVSELVRLGQRARLHPNPQVAVSGEEILQQALRLKVRCLGAHWKLKAAMFCPTLLSPSGSLADGYSHVFELAHELPEELAA